VGILDTLNLDAHFWLIVCLIVAFGGLGGLVNYCLRGVEEKNKPTTLLRAVVETGTTFSIVPLFLNMISSDLLAGSRTDSLKVLVFAGFCLVAAISARAFITSLTDKVVRELKEKADAAGQRAMVADQKATGAVETSAEPAAPARSVPRHEGADVRHSIADLFKIDPEDERLLKMLRDSKYKFRTVEGLASESSMDPLVVNNRLVRLQNIGYVGTVESGGRKLWYITGDGRSALTDG